MNLPSVARGSQERRVSLNLGPNFLVIPEFECEDKLKIVVINLVEN